jgi:multisubunit Na+/H+ antiporter MnhB subunit
MDFTAICVVGILVLGVYKLFELFVRKKERLMIVEKISLIVDEKGMDNLISLPNLVFSKRDYGSWSLRISLLLIGVGLGCIAAFVVLHNLFPLNVYASNDWLLREYMEQVQVILYFSFITIFGGIGLLIAYLIESKLKKKQE